MNEEIQSFIQNQIQLGIQNYIENVRQSQVQTSPKDGWIHAKEARAAGDFDISPDLHDVFQQEFTKRLYAKSSITNFLSKHPEPKGGFLKTQHLDHQMLVPTELRKRDEHIEELQRAVLCINRPIISVFSEIAYQCEQDENTKQIAETLRDTMRYVMHVGASIELFRRQEIARATGANPYIEALAKTDSDDPNQLLGNELREKIESDKKARAPKVSHPPHGKPKRGGKPFRNQRPSERTGSGNQQSQPHQKQ